MRLLGGVMRGRWQPGSVATLSFHLCRLRPYWRAAEQILILNSGCVNLCYTSCYLDQPYPTFSMNLVFLEPIIMATFLCSGTLRWADLSSRLQRATTTLWEAGGRFGSASISLCALPCGRWCLTSMVRSSTFRLCCCSAPQCYKNDLTVKRMWQWKLFLFVTL